MRRLPSICAGVLFCSIAGRAQSGPPDSVTLSNDKLEIQILKQGASLASVVLRSDAGKLNPLWRPEQRANGGYGHFICVDGFGGVSPEEAKAGVQGHGEAVRTAFDVNGPTT